MRHALTCFWRILVSTLNTRKRSHRCYGLVTLFELKKATFLRKELYERSLWTTADAAKSPLGPRPRHPNDAWKILTVRVKINWEEWARAKWNSNTVEHSSLTRQSAHAAR